MKNDRVPKKLLKWFDRLVGFVRWLEKIGVPALFIKFLLDLAEWWLKNWLTKG